MGEQKPNNTKKTKEEDYSIGCFKENYMVLHVCPLATGGHCKEAIKCINRKG